MELIEYDKNSIHKTHPSASVKEILSSQLVADTIQESGLSRYIHRDTILEKLEAQLTAIELAMGKNFTRQRILDLGCGSMDSFDTDLLGRAKFAPWLARVLHKLGVQVVGVDIGDLSKESFKGIQINLLNPNTLTAALGPQRFDLVHSASLYTSPMLQFLVDGNPWGLEQARSANTLVNNLYPQIEKLLKRNGCYLYSEGSRKYGTSEHYPLPRLAHRLSLENLLR